MHVYESHMYSICTLPTSDGPKAHGIAHLEADLYGMTIHMAHGMADLAASWDRVAVDELHGCHHHVLVIITLSG
jgi:hypothetical protein